MDTAVNPVESAFEADILLVDVSGLAYAAMYSPQGKLSHNDFPTGAIHGALTSIFSRMNQRPGAVPFVLWDRKAHWRHEMYPDYKAGRAADPDKQAIRESCKRQAPITQLILTAMGIPQVACGGAEADDVSGVICRHIDPSWMLEMTTRDTDWFQNITERIVWYSPLIRRQVSLQVLADPDNGLSDGNFLSTWEYLQAKALAGDKSDEIGGVGKVGLPTAVKYLREHGGEIENFWAAVDAGTVKPKGVVMERLASQASREIYRRNLKLMDWRLAPPLRTDELALVVGEPNWERAQAIAEDYGLTKVITQARQALAPWKNGWGTAVQAVDAALHHQHCLPVLNPRRPAAAQAVEVLDEADEMEGLPA